MAIHPAGRRAEPAVPRPAADLGTIPGKPPADRGGATPPDEHAVIARSILAAASSLRLALGDRSANLVTSHAVLPDGTVVLAVDAMSRTGGLLVAERGRPGSVRLDVTQVVPLAVRSRIRNRIRLAGTAGRLDPARLDSCDAGTVMSLLDLPPVALWAIEPVEVALVSGGEPAPVDIAAFRAARPDPLAPDEAAHLHHLARCHRDVLDRIATRCGLTPTGTARIVPIALDASGLVLRAERPDGHTDLRLTFARPVSSVPTLAEALRELLD
ncbi:DUF2470 domain-containing protein [Micromonospora sp. NPDC051300]|uniref:DUF2470 domain-containing protein n=1 Tax=Micromonospora sp. NPDC051300 TaxID=3364286 RepID=UPI0037A65582